MRKSNPCFLLGALIVVTAGSHAVGSVSLAFTNGGGTPTSASVARGGTFSVTLDLISVTTGSTDFTDQVTGLDFVMSASAGNIFTITGRNTTGNPNGDFGGGNSTTPNGDSVVPLAASNPTLNIASSGVFVNGKALGGQDGGNAVANTTESIGIYTMSIPSTAPLGTYTLSTFENPGFGYTDNTSSFANHSFASPGTYTVTVINPEPASTAFISFGLAGLMLRRGRRTQLSFV